MFDSTHIPTRAECIALCQAAVHDGAQWSYAGPEFNLNLLVWSAGHGIEQHRNHELDVVLLGVVGFGEVTLNGMAHRLVSGGMLVVPRGATRSLRATSARWGYLSVHQPRAGLLSLVDRRAQASAPQAM